jgi:ABC-type lipoprotein release transport system permease subunit
MEEGSVNVLNMDRRLVGTILVLIVNMQKMNIFTVLLGQIL